MRPVFFFPFWFVLVCFAFFFPGLFQGQNDGCYFYLRANLFSDARVTLLLSLLKSPNAVIKASSPRSHPSECIMTLCSDSNLF